MKEYSNAYSNLDATLNENLDHEPDERFFRFTESDLEFFVSLKSNLENPGPGSPIENTCLLALLRGLVKKKGFCFASDDYLMKSTGWKKTKLREMIKFMHDNKLIFINSWATKHGKIRHIITSDNAIKYRDNWFKKKPTIPDEIRDKYAEHFGLDRASLNPDSPKPKANTGIETLEKPNIGIRHCDTVSESDSASLLRKGINRKKESDRENVAAISSNQFIYNSKEHIEYQIDQAQNIPKKDKSLAKKYLAIRLEYIQAQDSAMAHIVDALKKGYAHEVVSNHEIVLKEEKKKAEASEAIEQIAKDFKKEFRDTCWFDKIKISPVNIIVYYKKNGENASTDIDLTKEGYQEKINIIKKRMYECLK